MSKKQNYELINTKKKHKNDRIKLIYIYISIKKNVTKKMINEKNKKVPFYPLYNNLITSKRKLKKSKYIHFIQTHRITCKT